LLKFNLIWLHTFSDFSELRDFSMLESILLNF
jgi:hypothetical protein